MEMNDFVRLENLCQLRFMEEGDLFHVCTQEDLPVIFHNEQEFKAAMNVLALVSFMSPEVRMYTFAIMDNHFHLLLSGSEDKVRQFADLFVERLSCHSELKKYKNDILKMVPKLFKIENLENLRNVIAYINRNGAVVSSSENVFSYRWGANRYFFNPEAKLRYNESGHIARQAEKRQLMKSHFTDNVNDVIVLDGYVSPLCYCHVDEAERFFRNSRQYFYKVSKNVESQKDIARIIGERNFYCDEDLYSLVVSICSNNYGVRTTSELNSDAKIEIAKRLHHEYNATNKQISRLLRMRIEIIAQLFPA